MVNSLLAIILVVSSSRGSHFVFHYPKDPKRRVEIEQVRRESDLDEEIGDDNDVITWPYGLTEDFDNWSLRSRLEEENEEYDFNSKKQANNSTGNDEIERNEMNKLFGFEKRLLADIFCPKHKGLTKFQLSVDDLTFVGQPVFLKTKVDTKKKRTFSRERDLRKKVDDDDNGADLDNDEGLQEQLFDALNEETSKIFSNVSSDYSNASSIDSMQQHLHSTFFHLVFVLEPPELELCRQVDDIYDNIVTKLTSALRYEQLRCDYVRKEAELMLSLRENYVGNTTSDELMEVTLKKSSLARTIRKVYDAISSDNVAHILINDYIDLSLQIPPLVPTVNSSDNDMVGHGYAHYPVIAPYHTLLLLEDPEEILKNMPLDANPTLVQLVQILTPTQRLADLCTVLDCSLAQMFRLAAHLIYWRKAKIIDVIGVRNVYVVSPTADMNSLPSYVEYFKQHFPTLDLVKTLDSFSDIRPKISSIKEQRTIYLEAITYLLKKDLIVQLHVYILVMIPQYIKLGYTKAEYEEKLKNSRDSESHGLTNNSSLMDNNAIISPFEKASDSEREWFTSLVANQPKETVSLFERLTKYFNGKHHVDEILFRETLKPKELSNILCLFSKDQLTVVLC